MPQQIPFLVEKSMNHCHTAPSAGGLHAHGTRSAMSPRARPRCSFAAHLRRWVLAIVMMAGLFSMPVAAETPTSIDMKLLVISADGNEPVFAAIKSILNQIGVPYDAMIATNTPLTAQTLSDGLGAGRYQGILLATGNLGYQTNAGDYQSAFTAAQWEMLWQYERDFKVRQVTLYTYPSGPPDSYGLGEPLATDTTTTPIAASLTAEGKTIFGYLNPDNPISIRNAYTYLSMPVSSANPVPLLRTPDGYALASIYTYADGRQNLAMTMDGNPDLVHTLLLGYGTVNWVSKGFFLGQRKIHMTAQPDDVLIADDLWVPSALSDTTGAEYRITGADYTKLVSWQRTVRAAHPNNAQLRLEMPYNGVGASGVYPNDTLTSTVRKNSGPFGWVNHTYDHELLDFISEADALRQLEKNHKVAQQLNFNLYSKDSMIQPEISGLNNPAFFAAAKSFGIRYILSDTSQPGWKSPSPNTGIVSTIEPSILIIPRYPTNLFYNVSTPEEWTSEYNHFYAPGGLFPAWDRALTYEEILDKESEMWLRYLLKYDVNPVMFHQTNLRAYPPDGARSLLGDLINITLAKYNALYALPILSPRQHEIGVMMSKRMAYNNSGIGGKIVFSGGNNTITLRAANAVSAPLTGIKYGSTFESYGGQVISTIPLNANISVANIPAPAW
jgi:hypothetical protein